MTGPNPYQMQHPRAQRTCNRTNRQQINKKTVVENVEHISMDHQKKKAEAGAKPDAIRVAQNNDSRREVGMHIHAIPNHAWHDPASIPPLEDSGNVGTYDKPKTCFWVCKARPNHCDCFYQRSLNYIAKIGYSSSSSDQKKAQGQEGRKRYWQEKGKEIKIVKISCSSSIDSSTFIATTRKTECTVRETMIA